MVTRLAAVIRVDALWLSTTPLDMRAGTETILARVVQVFGEARPHHAYLFANRRANRMKVLVHNGYGIWLAHRRLNQGRFKTEHLSPEQGQLFEETVAADLAAMSEELEQFSSPNREKSQAKRKPLPPELPRTEIHHEPESTTCSCGCQMKRIGEDVAEKLDYTPGVFTVERHIRGKWVCATCETLVQAPVPAHVIDKGIPTTGLLGTCPDREISGSSAAVPSGRHLWSGGIADSAIDAGAVGRPDGRHDCNRSSMH